MIVFELARPMLSLDPHFKGVVLQWEHFQINKNINPASRDHVDFLNWPPSMLDLVLLTLVKALAVLSELAVDWKVVMVRSFNC